ncbi:MAG: MBL fold metallo-hydrolase [Patescibacteria group bacterium]
MKINVEILGGAREIGGENCVLIKTDKTTLMIDRGKRASQKGDSELVTPDKIDALMYTHGHLDHCGLAPELYQALKGGFRNIMSPVTYEFARSHWVTTLKMDERKGRTSSFSEKILYDMLVKAEKIHHGAEFEIGDIKVRAIGVGHILGSLGYHLTIGKTKIFISGDFSLGDTDNPHVPSFDTSFLKDNVNILILNATYAGVESPMLEDEADRFIADVKQYLQEERQILIPVFSIDRPQKVFYFLQQAGLERHVYIDGGARNWFQTFRILGNSDYKPPVDRFMSNLRDHENFSGHVQGLRPVIIMASAGMLLKKSKSYTWANPMIEKDDAVIMFTGYQASDTPGANLLLASRNGEKINWTGSEKVIKASVKQYKFSAHARSPEVTELIRICNPSSTLFMHCESPGIDKFIKDNSMLPGEMVIVENNKTYNF